MASSRATAPGLARYGRLVYGRDMTGRALIITLSKEDIHAMGMFDKPQYLTGKQNGYADVGDTFYLHNARIDGVSTVGGVTRPKAKLLVSRDGNPSETTVVYSSGAAITTMVSRIDSDDRAAMPTEVRLDMLPPSKPGQNGTHILTPADQPEPSEYATADNGDADF